MSSALLNLLVAVVGLVVGAVVFGFGIREGRAQLARQLLGPISRCDSRLNALLSDLRGDPDYYGPVESVWETLRHAHTTLKLELSAGGPPSVLDQDRRAV